MQVESIFANLANEEGASFVAPAYINVSDPYQLKGPAVTVRVRGNGRGLIGVALVVTPHTVLGLSLRLLHPGAPLLVLESLTQSIHHHNPSPIVLKKSL